MSFLTITKHLANCASRILKRNVFSSGQMPSKLTRAQMATFTYVPDTAPSEYGKKKSVKKIKINKKSYYRSNLVNSFYIKDFKLYED